MSADHEHRGQAYTAWFTAYPSTHECAGQPVEIVTRQVYEALAQRHAEAVERLREMNECVRIYLQHSGEVRPGVRPGWLEEEVAATDAFLGGGSMHGESKPFHEYWAYRWTRSVRRLWRGSKHGRRNERS
jgi:hypothetical protein